MLRLSAFTLAVTLSGTAAAHAAPVTAFDCTPIDLKLRGLHVIYAIDQRERTVHESMRDDSGAPYAPDPRRSPFREQTLPVEFDDALVLWSVQAAKGTVRRILDRTSNILTISAPIVFSGQPHIVDAHISCQKLRPARGFSD
jgi:hypothetical protein